MRGFVLLLGVVGIAALAGCREPTQIRVEIRKAFKCPDQDGKQTIFETGLTVGKLDTYQDNPLSTESAYCDDSGGLPSEIGNVIITPIRGKRGRVAFEVISGYRVPVQDCVGWEAKEQWSALRDKARPGEEEGCIWSSRVAGFSRHDTVRIPVMMRFACLNVKCDGNNQVCVRGNCVSNECAPGETLCDLDPEPGNEDGAAGTNAGGASAGGSGAAGAAQGGFSTGGLGFSETGGLGARDTGGSSTQGGENAAGHAGATSGTTGAGGSGGAGGSVGGMGGSVGGSGGTAGGTGGIADGAGGTAGAAGSSGGPTGGVGGSTGGALSSGGNGGGGGGELNDFRSCRENQNDTTCNGESCCIAPWIDTSAILPMGMGTGDAYAPNDVDEGPEHDVTLSGFYLDRYEVTVSRFRPFVDDVRSGWQPDLGQGAHPHADVGTDTGWQEGWSVNLATLTSCLTFPTTWTESPGTQEDWPINCISWETAFAFCVWDDDARLPTEAEWEYVAAGGGQNRIFPFLSGQTPPVAGVQAVYASGTPASVGSGELGWSHFDLSGNIEEWVFDFYDLNYYQTVRDRYDPDPCTDFECVNTTESAYRVVRGGNYQSEAYQVRAVSRSYSSPTLPNAWNGVRCARDR